MGPSRSSTQSRCASKTARRSRHRRDPCGACRRGAAIARRSLVVQRPRDIGAFQFVVLTSLRAAQLMRGCRPRVDGAHKPIMIAQAEVAEGKVVQLVGLTVSDSAGPETA